MAVIAVWQCDRDGSMFEDKKQAEEHDKYLELAANITSLIESEIPGISDQHSEAIGLLLAQRREQLAKACKGKPEELLEPFQADVQPKGVVNSGLKSVDKDTDSKEVDNKGIDNNVTSLAANQ